MTIYVLARRSYFSPDIRESVIRILYPEIRKSEILEIQKLNGCLHVSPEALITSGRQINFGFIEAELTNEFGSAKLTPQKLNVVYRPSGGCTVVANGRSDISLFLMLILLTLYHRRKNL